VEAEGGARILCQLATFLAFGVGEEAEAVFVDAFDEDHAHAGLAVPGRGCKGCAIGIAGLVCSCFFEPGIEKV